MPRRRPDPDDLVPLTPEEKELILPELARRAALLYAIVHAGMVREARNDEEAALWDRLREFYPRDA